MEVKPKTNADRIRAMTDEELVEYLSNVHYCPTPPICDSTKNGNHCRRRVPVVDGVRCAAGADEYGGLFGDDGRMKQTA